MSKPPISGLESLIEDVRQARLTVAERRAHGTAERYPEIIVDSVEPLPDGEIIRQALRRELAHQQQVVRSMGND
jgi:hypothetical protein